jgi:hypothetical protein
VRLLWVSEDPMSVDVLFITGDSRLKQGVVGESAVADAIAGEGGVQLTDPYATTARWIGRADRSESRGVCAGCGSSPLPIV